LLVVDQEYSHFLEATHDLETSMLYCGILPHQNKESPILSAN
jgi:hypothetical protein